MAEVNKQLHKKDIFARKPNRNKRIYELVKQGELSLREIGKLYNISGERVRKICLEQAKSKGYAQSNN